MSFRPPGDCPNCDEPVPARAKACPHCGATAEAGWDEGSVHGGLDLPDDAPFDHDGFMEREFGTPRPKAASTAKRLWPWVALALAAAFIWMAWGWALHASG